MESNVFGGGLYTKSKWSISDMNKENIPGIIRGVALGTFTLFLLLLIFTVYGSDEEPLSMAAGIYAGLTLVSLIVVEGIDLFNR